jgi:predicted membrane-bound spermidine synthase
VKVIEPDNILDGRIPRGDVPVVAVLFIAFIMASVFFGLPMLSKEELRNSLKSERKALVYFACLGLGFIFVEVCLIQRFVLFLGHPVYSISIVLCSLLLAAGLGSLLSEKIKPVPNNIIFLLLSLAAAVLVMHFSIPWLSRVFVDHSLPVRMGIAIVFIAASGLLLGMPMPIAIRYLKQEERHVIPWGWAINGYFGVVGSALTVLVAINFGFGAVFYIAALCYAIAPFFLVRKSSI